jgi:hypothetical protein
MQIKNTHQLLIYGVYMNHHDEEYKGKKHYDAGCSGQIYVPQISESNVIEMTDSSFVGIHRSELMGSGFIGIKTANAQNITVIDTVIHDCVSEALRLDKNSSVSVNNSLIFDTGNKTYSASYKVWDCSRDCLNHYEKYKCKNWCRESKSWLSRKYGGSKSFKTAIHISKDSTLSLSQVTLVEKEGGKSTRAFDNYGTLTIKNSLIDHKTLLYKKATRKTPLWKTVASVANCHRKFKQLEQFSTIKALHFSHPRREPCFATKKPHRQTVTTTVPHCPNRFQCTLNPTKQKNNRHQRTTYPHSEFISLCYMRRINQSSSMTITCKAVY